MARLREAPPRPGDRPQETAQVPDRLAVCYLDDWLSADELDELLTPLRVHEEDRPKRVWQLQGAARGRFRAARKTWIAEQQAAGRTVPHLDPPGRPRRRPGGDR